MTRIAVVDDDTAFLTLLEDMLEAEGWDVCTVPETEAALEELKRVQPDLVLLDIRGDASQGGWKLLDLLIEDGATSNTPVIVFSAIPKELRARESWLNERRIGILPKPFNIADLHECVRTALNRGQPGCVGLAENVR